MHAKGEETIGELEGLAPSDETYNAKLQVLIESVKPHR